MAFRTYLVTGASNGIGRALSEQLSKSGHRVIGIARTADDPTFPGMLVPLDLGDSKASAAGLAELAEEYAFDGVINNVGLVRPQALGAIDLITLDDVLRLNLHPALLAAQALLPGMRERGWGRIVNIASLVVLGAPERTAYAAAKAALISFARS